MKKEKENCSSIEVACMLEVCAHAIAPVHFLELVNSLLNSCESTIAMLLVINILESLGFGGQRAYIRAWTEFLLSTMTTS
jgi:hypothetical protein